jgi:hypothetical protein
MIGGQLGGNPMKTTRPLSRTIYERSENKIYRYVSRFGMGDRISSFPVAPINLAGAFIISPLVLRFGIPSLLEAY